MIADLERVDPEPETAELPIDPEKFAVYQAFTTTDRGTAAATDTPAFVGRERELGALAAGLADVREGRGRLLALAGEPGIGKTSTVEEFLRAAALPDHRVLWGRAPEHEGAPAYWPWIQVLRALADGCDDATLATVIGTAAGDVGPLVSEIGLRLGRVPPPVAPDPEQARFQLFDSVASCLRRAAAAAAEPLVVVLDDLHWADEASLLLLGFVAGELRRARLLIVVAYRQVEMRRLAGHFADVARASERIPLGGLAPDEVQDFVQHATAVVPHGELVASLHRVTEGNPFFLGEMVHMLHAAGSLTGRPLDESAVPLPDEVRDVIRKRVAPLAPEERAVLVMAAVLGRELDLAVLQRAVELPAVRVLEVLAAADRAGLVREVAGSAGRYRFVHVLIRETLYGDLPALERARLHRHVGLALETLHEEAREAPLAELARHFFYATPLGDIGRAVEYATRAGERAMTRLGYEVAVRHFERGLEALALQPGDGALRLGLLLRLGEAAWRAGDVRKARAVLEDAAACARALGSAEALAQTAVTFGRVSTETGVVDQALVALLEEALAALGDADSGLRAALLARLAMALYFTREEERRAALTDEAVAVARRVGEPVPLVGALITRQLMLWGVAGVDQQLALADEALAVARAIPDPQPGFEIERFRMLAQQVLGDMPGSHAALDAYARRAAQVRLPTYRWHAAVVGAMRLLMLGKLDEGERVAAEALAMRQHGFGSQSGQAYLIQTFVVYREHGRLAELEPALTALARGYPGLPVWRFGLALLRAETGQADGARTLVAPFAADGLEGLPRDGNFVPALVILAEVVHQLEEPRWAELVYPLLLPFASWNVVVGLSAACYGSAARYLGLAAATLGRRADAYAHFEEALAMNARTSARVLEAYTRYDYARLLLGGESRAERARAVELLAPAHRAAEELALPRLRARLAALDAVPVPAAPRTQDAGAGAAMIFRKDGQLWTVAFGVHTMHLKDTKGMAYLATLLRHPEREFHALDLATGGAGGEGAAPAAPADAALAADGLGDAGDMLDPAARAAYKARVVELRAELLEAERFNDLGRAARARAEIDAIGRELARAVGLGGRSRKAGSVAERARLNVSRAIAAAVRKIAAEHPELGEHLTATVRTGVFCSYSPDPRLRIRWQA